MIPGFPLLGYTSRSVVSDYDIQLLVTLYTCYATWYNRSHGIC